MGFIEHALHERQTHILRQLGKPGFHLGCESLVSLGARCVFPKQGFKPLEVIQIRGEWLIGECHLQRLHSAADVSERLQVPYQGIEAGVSGEDRAF